MKLTLTLRSGLSCLALLLALAGGARAQDAPAMAPVAAASDLPSTKAAANSYKDVAPYDWSGFYLGGHLGDTWGKSNWTAGTLPGAPVPAGATIASGSYGLTQCINPFKKSGSWFEGVQAGYNYMFPNRVVIGAEADFAGVAFPDPDSNFTTGGMSILVNTGETYNENVLYSGTARGRIGYAPGSWLFYATGGFAWSLNQYTLTQLSSGYAWTTNARRLGWAVGAGVEAPLTDHWTTRLEYLYLGYGNRSVDFPSVGQRFVSNTSEQQLRLGLNYHFDGEAAGTAKNAVPGFFSSDDISLHGQATVVSQGYPAFPAAYSGPNSLPNYGEVRETADLTLFLGFKPWPGAELWANPEIDQGYGPGNTLGTAGYTSGEAYKKGLDWPYARIQRFFVRQTIDLGGETQKVEADQNVFEGSQTANRLVLTVGRFFIPDMFDTNKYANNPKGDFLNWSVNNAGTFDFAGDAWGSTYGAAAEWYQGRFTLRGGVFDMTTTPAGAESPDGVVNDPTFGQFELVGEAEERHELWGQPGKLKLLGYLIDGRMGAYSDAIAYINNNPGVDPGSAMQSVRRWNTRPGASLNLEQQVTADVGIFARAGWGDGKVEIYDFTDIDRTVSGGLSLSGNLWGRRDDTFGLAGVINGISGEHQAYLNAGGLGLQIGDGVLTNYGSEKVIETYYSLPIFDSARLSFDYQRVVNPAYNKDRGPVSLFAARVHIQF